MLSHAWVTDHVDLGLWHTGDLEVGKQSFVCSEIQNRNVICYHPLSDTTTLLIYTLCVNVCFHLCC